MFMLPYLALRWLRQAAIGARRRDRTAHYVAWSVVAGIASALLVACALSFAVLLWSVSLWWLAVPMIAVLALPAIAGPLLRHVLIPAGYHRAAYHLALSSLPGADPQAYAQCIAAWAAAQAADDRAALAWVAAKRDARKPLGDAEIATTALLAAGRGDAATARGLLRSLTMIVENHPAVRELAGEWLACDAAARGAWRELFDDATGSRWPATPLTYLLEGIAARHIGAAGAPSGTELWGRWLLAPRRRATRDLVVEALAIPAAAPAPHDAVEPSELMTPLPRAVAAHLAFETTPPTPATLAFTVRAWDTALGDAATHSWLARRALELDAPTDAVERAIRDVAGAVTDDLARRAEAADLAAPPGADGPVGQGVTRRLRHGRLDALEAAFSRWADRRLAPGAQPAIDEWRCVVALWAAYQAVVAAGGIELRRLAFPHAFSKGSSMAAWLWNKRAEYAMSHAISAWLLAEALVVGDTEAIELGHRNCALAVPTRLGQIQP